MDTRRYSFVAIPWSDSKWCYSSGYIDRSTVTRLGAEAADDGSFMSFSYRLHAVCIFFVPNTGKGIIILGVSVAMHGRQDSTTPDHGIEATKSNRSIVSPSSWFWLFPDLSYMHTTSG